jgi:hypothetical protein
MIEGSLANKVGRLSSKEEEAVDDSGATLILFFFFSLKEVEKKSI